MAKNFDWDQIEADYRTGAMSNRQLSRLYGPDESTIRGRAKRYRWTRDLRSQYKSELRRQRIAHDSGLRERVSEDDDVVDDKIVAQAAQKVMAIINKHREATTKAFKGVEGVQDAINQQIKDASEKKKGMTPAELKLLSQAQQQNSRSLSNIINSDRRSYDMDEGVDDTMPDTIKVTFRRERNPTIE